jgi:hypothetical protein
VEQERELGHDRPLPWTKGSIVFGLGLLAIEGGLIALDAVNVVEAGPLIHAALIVGGGGLALSGALSLRGARRQ